MNKMRTAPPSEIWAIESVAARAMLQMAQTTARERVYGDMSPEDDPGGWGSPVYSLTESGDAVISMRGVMTKHPTCATYFFGGCVTKEVAQSIRDAEADTRVSRVVLLIDSPGGEVSGTEQLARVVRECSKPTVAVIEDCGCSAAYWVASQADEVVANSTALVGSIGVYFAVADWSKWLDNEGVKITEFTSGAIKGAGSGLEVTDAQAASIQANIDSLFAVFRADVERKRTINPDVYDARILVGEGALAAGLIDRIGALSDVLAGDEPAMPSMDLTMPGESPAAEAATNMDKPTPNLMDRVSAALGLSKAENPDEVMVAKIERLTAEAESSAKAAFDIRLDAMLGGLVAAGKVLPASRAAAADHLRACYLADNEGRFTGGADGALFTGAVALLESAEGSIVMTPIAEGAKELDPSGVQPRDIQAEAKAFNDLAKPKGL